MPKAAKSSHHSDSLSDSLKRLSNRTKVLFQENPAFYTQDAASQRLKLASKIFDEYRHVQTLPPELAQQQATTSSKSKKIEEVEEIIVSEPSHVRNMIEEVVEQETPSQNQLVRYTETTTSNSLVQIQQPKMQIKPEWHAPWKLMRVISGHLGWVRAVAVEPGNQWFATGAGDRLIKIWDLASGQLKLSLTGHISTVRALVVSERHPYMFSCGEDKMIKCWDLEQNKVIRHYHGHLSGVYSLAIHPTLDVLVSGGRDSTVRVWDIRTKAQIFALSGHTNTVSDVRCQEADPQIISASMDSTVRLWDLAAGRTMAVLTHHKKAVRALALHPTEFSFVSGAPDAIKQWRCPEGKFVQDFKGQNSIVNTLAVNRDNIMFSGGDNGSMFFWDWKSGYNYQSMDAVAQPGSLESEAGIFCSTFDRTGTRLITGEADKTIKMWKQDENATEETHPLQWKPSQHWKS